MKVRRNSLSEPWLNQISILWDDMTGRNIDEATAKELLIGLHEALFRTAVVGDKVRMVDDHMFRHAKNGDVGTVVGQGSVDWGNGPVNTDPSRIERV